MHVLMLLRDLGLDPDGAPAREALERVRSGVVWPGWGPRRWRQPVLRRRGRAVHQRPGRGRGRTSARTSTDSSSGCWGSSCRTAGGTARPRTVLRARRSTPRSASSRRCWRGSARAARQTGCRPHGTGARSTSSRGTCCAGSRPASRSRPTARADRPAPPRSAFPTWWHYDVLRALEHLRATGVPADGRVAEAVDPGRLEARPRRPLGAGAQVHAGTLPVDLGEAEGQPRAAGSPCARCGCCAGTTRPVGKDANQALRGARRRASGPRPRIATVPTPRRTRTAAASWARRHTA